MATPTKGEQLHRPETAESQLSPAATAEAATAGLRLEQQTADGVPPRDILKQLAEADSAEQLPGSQASAFNDFFNSPEGEQLFAGGASSESDPAVDDTFELPVDESLVPQQAEALQNEKLTLVHRLREQPEEEGRQARAEALGEESLVQETNRQLWLRGEIVNGLAEKVRAGNVKVSQGHGGFRLVGEGMLQGAGGVFTAAELREYGLDVAAEFAANNPNAREAYDTTTFEIKAETKTIDTTDEAGYEQAVTELAAFEESVATGDLNITENGDGTFSFQGEDAPAGTYAFDHLEGAGLFAAQDARERASLYGDESESQRDARLGALRTAVGDGLIGRIRSGEEGQVVVQTHKGWTVKGFEGIYTAAELRSLGVMEAAQVYETRHSKTLAETEVEETAVADETVDVVSEDGPVAEEAPTEEEVEEQATLETETDAAAETDGEEEPAIEFEESAQPQAETLAEAEKINFESMTVAEIKEYIRRGEQLIVMMERFKSVVEVADLSDDHKEQIVAIINKIIEAQSALNQEAQDTLAAQENQAEQKAEIANVQGLINELMQALTFPDETRTPEQQKNQEKQQSLLAQLVAMLLEMLFTPQSDRNA